MPKTTATPAEIVRENVIKRRKAFGWSQERFSEESGVSQSTISRFESGGGVSNENLNRMLSALRLSYEEAHGQEKPKIDLPEDFIALAPAYQRMPQPQR